jgi:hypothetical protein
MIPLESVNHETFAPHLGSTFTVITSAGGIELRLHSVDKLGHRRPDAARDPFSIRFLGAHGLLLDQGIYLLSCDGFGEIEMFITQIAGGSRDAEFEAVFT